MRACPVYTAQPKAFCNHHCQRGGIKGLSAASLGLPVAELARVQTRSLATLATGKIFPAARLNGTEQFPSGRPGAVAVRSGCRSMAINLCRLTGHVAE